MDQLGEKLGFKLQSMLINTIVGAVFERLKDHVNPFTVHFYDVDIHE